MRVTDCSIGTPASTLQSSSTAERVTIFAAIKGPAMEPIDRVSCSASLAAVAAFAFLSGCANGAPEPFSREALVEETATVAAVDADARVVALRDKTGEITAIYAGPEVRNFDRINVGDEVEVTYRAAVAAELTTLDQPTSGGEKVTMAQRAEPGEQPHGQLSSTVTTTVQIDAVDPKAHTVSFHRDDGYVRTVTLEDAKAREFAKGLKRGDVVKITYSEAIAVAVRPTTASDDAG
jgi:hypothetical protein